MAATVLLVEDERKLRELVRSYLERAGLTVLSTGSGAEAITLSGAASPDLVVLDLGLPDVPGEVVARELRAAGPIPIVMLTAKGAEEDRIAGLELGADDYVTKPFSPGNWCCGYKRSCAAAAKPPGRVPRATATGSWSSTSRSARWSSAGRRLI
ncbi:MAG: response regulator transcription factor [Streptosporangiaceae bacterium]